MLMSEIPPGGGDTQQQAEHLKKSARLRIKFVPAASHDPFLISLSFVHKPHPAKSGFRKLQPFARSKLTHYRDIWLLLTYSTVANWIGIALDYAGGESGAGDSDGASVLCRSSRVLSAAARGAGLGYSPSLPVLRKVFKICRLSPDLSCDWAEKSCFQRTVAAKYSKSDT
jgi:hypothetical protein